ncbi:MAG: glycosyltransferase family 4 protein [Chloroflexi bacterium]|nr:glycosyltransferase family 4 protein [Chloroflexota bacterium]
MRILMLSWEYPPHIVGGLGRHVAELVPALVQAGIEVHLVTPRWAGGEAKEEGDGLTVYRVDPPDVPMPDFYTSVWQTNIRLEQVGGTLCQEKGIDLIHNHEWLTAFSATALKRNFRIPLLSTIHATEQGRARGHLVSDMQKAIHSVEWWLTYESWRIICCSQYMAKEVINYFKAPADKIDVIPNGVQVDRFQHLEGVDLSRFRSMYALPDEKIVFYVGRIVHEKGVHVLVEAAPRVLAENPSAKFVIAGTGDLLPALRARAWDLGIGHKVLFTGFIPDEDRDRLYKVASCAVFPSLYEPFGIVALEAMAAKVPVVVSLVGGLQEVVKHAETGITVYPDNPESLAWGINHTLARPDWAAQRAENAYRVVREEYNWRRIAQKTIQVYERIVAERARTAW